ncbi:MAG: hypothetical protein LBH81_03930 [Rickettsiales bacterium]|jgi:hypothetical protein|nr:hypothetical protein [Rickettsiales bacterium]
MINKKTFILPLLAILTGPAIAGWDADGNYVRGGGDSVVYGSETDLHLEAKKKIITACEAIGGEIGIDRVLLGNSNNGSFIDTEQHEFTNIDGEFIAILEASAAGMGIAEAVVGAAMGGLAAAPVAAVLGSGMAGGLALISAVELATGNAACYFPIDCGYNESECSELTEAKCREFSEAIDDDVSASFTWGYIENKQGRCVIGKEPNE